MQLSWALALGASLHKVVELRPASALAALLRKVVSFAVGSSHPYVVPEMNVEVSFSKSQKMLSLSSQTMHLNCYFAADEAGPKDCSRTLYSRRPAITNSVETLPCAQPR